MTWAGPVSVEQLLDFAAAHPGPYTGHVDEAARRELGISGIRYLQLLRRAIDTEDALRHDPQTTHRLLREADRRARNREARTAGH